MRTEERLKVIYETIAPAITRNETAWKDYLKFGSQVYKHQFDNALLIYAQNPKTTMLATTPIWNKVGRYINKGEKGIAVCEYQNAKLTLKYLFDVTQTNGKAVPEQWVLDEEKAQALSDRLSYSHNITATNLNDCISQIVDNTLAESVDDYLQDFETDIKDHFLGTLPQDGLISELTETIENSCKYFIACKCGVETDYEPSMPTISHFDTVPLVTRLGYTVTEISKRVLLEIARSIRIIDTERRGQNERRNHEQQRASRNAERSATGEHNTGRGRADRQIRQDGDGLSAPKQPPKVFTFEDDRRTDSENEGGGRGSAEQGGGNHSKAPDPRPDAADGRNSGENPAPEQTESHSGGNRPERIGADTEITQTEEESHDSGSFSLPENQKSPFGQSYQTDSGKQTTLFETPDFLAEPPNDSSIIPTVTVSQSSGTENSPSEEAPDPYRDSTGYTEPFVVISWSESQSFGDNERLTFMEADLKFKEIEKTERQESIERYGKPLGYNKTWGNIYYLDNERDAELSTYEFRYDIGDYNEKQSGLFNHIANFWQYVEGRINSNEFTGYNNDDVANVKNMLGILSPHQDTAFIPYAENVDEQDAPEITDGSGGLVETISTTIAAEQEKPVTAHKTNYRYSEADNLYSGGAKSKFKANIESIKLLQRLESDKRPATPDEQKILANYVGWGGLANAFSDTASGWENEYQELKLLLDEDEYKSAMNSTITAYYTEPKLIEYVYKALGNFGFNGGSGRKILDPAMGTGNFFSVLPDNLQSTKLYGVELDSITGRIAGQLYPNADISVQGFETTRFDDNSFDVAIGNIPFNNIKLYDKRYEEQDFLIHDYFIAKSLDLVKPGGLITYITSKGTMDKRDTSVREYIARRADLIGAIRLPNNAFKQLAGTEVTADILFLKKRGEALDELTAGKFSLPDWVFTNQNKDAYMTMNQYFLDNPDMILGEMQFSRNMYGREDGTACIAPAGQDLYAEVDRAIGKLSATFTAEPDKPVQKAARNDETISDEEDNRIKAPHGTKNCVYVIRENSIFYCENGWLVPQNITGKKAERIKGLCEIKSALQAVIAVQSREYQYNELESAQKKLNEVYDTFIAKNGYINSKANTAAFSDDDQLALLCSIEDLNDDRETYRKTPIFTRATIKSYRKPTHADSAKEALEIALNMKMKVDLTYMANLCEKSEDEIISELGERIYLNPQKYYGNPYEGWETNEEYLSGDVAAKLAYARLKSEEYPIFERNVDALQAIQPPMLMPSDINFRIGSPWIPKEYFAQFMYETFDTPYSLKDEIDIDYLEYTTQWRIGGKRQDHSIKVDQTYGTGRVNAYEIYEDCLNLQSTTIRDPKPYIDKNGKEQIRYIINAAQTMIARAKQQQIKEAFANWLFRDKDRAEILLKIYNETFNTIRPREYDGAHLVFPNMNEEWELRPHQKNVAARIIYSGTCLMAHEVGAGKTAAMIAAGMYMKNIGAIKKPVYVVPNHLTAQWATEFMRFFPSANILVTTKKDFEKHNRKKFVSKIAVGEYDAIIIGHSQFEKIPISRERQEKQLDEEIAALTYIIDRMKKEKGENWAIKQIVIFQNNLKSRLERLVKAERKDDLLTFEQLGVDYMYVDEAHAYKNCFTYSKMRNVAGIGQSSSQRASDMLMKCQYLQEMNNGSGVTFATGTPISNSMSEMYVMQRFLQPNILKKMGLHYFDSWAATFGEVISSLEITPEGSSYRIKNRFAKFHNLPELMNIFKLIADIQTSDTLNLPVPKVKGGKAAVSVSQCSEFQKLIMQSFVERAEAIRKREVEPTVDNMLKLTNEAKLMAIDPRLVYEDAIVEPDSKLNTCIRNVYGIWDSTSEHKLTQVIFCDSGTPKPGKFNVYDEAKQQLIGMGVPENEIAFVHDAKTDTQRDEMFDKMRKGEIRILIGSTGKLGTGTNIQTKLIALHHLDVPWRPSDIIQRDGRGIRQYNTNPEIEIYRYVTKGTFDSYLWQIQEQKLRYITQIMTSKSISRSCEDADETVLTAAEVKAIATDNPMLAEKMEVDNEVTRLKLLRGNWNNEKLTLERNIKSYYPELIARCEGRIDSITHDIATLKKNKFSDFRIVVDGKAYDERPTAGDAFVTVMKAKCEVGGGAVPLGEYCGFQVLGERKNLMDTEIRIIGKGGYSTPIGDSGLGSITRIENLANKLPAFLQESEQTLSKTQSQLDEAKIIVLQSFQFEEKLNDYIARQSDINSRLEFKELSKQEGEFMNESGEDENAGEAPDEEYEYEDEDEDEAACM